MFSDSDLSTLIGKSGWTLRQPTDNGLDKVMQLETLEAVDSVYVGNFRVEFNAALVTTPAGEQHTVNEKALASLKVFLLNPNKYIKVDDLAEAVYGSVAISNAAIAQNIKQLRKAFEDTDKTIIETRHKVGYRLTLPIALEAPDQASEAEAQATRAVNWQRWLKHSIPLTAFLTLLVIAGFVLNIPPLDLAQDDDGKATTSLAQTPLTYLKGQEYFPSISNDRQWLVFSYRQQLNHWALYIKSMKSGIIKPLLEDSSYSYKHASFSPDHQLLIFTRLSAQRCEFVRASFNRDTGEIGEPEVVAECALSGQGAKAIVSNSGDTLFYNQAFAVDDTYKIYVKSLLNGQTWQLSTPPPTGKGDYYLTLSHSGKRLAVLRNIKHQITEIRLIDLETKDNRLVDKVATTLFNVNWGENDTSLIYKNAANQIVEFDLSSLQRQVIKRAAAPIYAPTVINQAEGRFAVIQGSLVNVDILKRSLPVGEPEPLVDSSFADALPALSVDKTQLAWVSDRSGIYQLWLKQMDQAERQLTGLSRSGRFSSLDFSPNGDQLGGTYEGLWFIYDIHEQTMRWSEPGDGHFANFSWRANGESVFLHRIDQEQSLMVELFPKANRYTLFEPLPNAELLLESGDGRWLYAWSKQDKHLYRFEQQTGEKQLLSEAFEYVSRNRWSINDSGLYFIRQQANDDSRLYYLPHKQLLDSAQDLGPQKGNIAVSADNLTLLTTKTELGQTELVEL